VDLYVLDSLFRRIAVVDNYESLIWTERFSDAGDFELKLSSTLGNRNLFTAGTRLAIDNSTRVMTVEAVQDATDDDNKDILTITGPSLEAMLQDRAAFKYDQDYVATPTWNITDTAANIARTLFDAVCRPGAPNTADVIPLLQTGSLYPASSIPESITTQYVEVAPQELFGAIKALTDPNELGFRLVRSAINNLLYFDIYSGNDLTTRQSTLSPVIFATGLDDLKDITELTSIQGSKNVAYVYSALTTNGFIVVYADHTPTDVEGFDRRVMTVDGSSITADNPDINGALIQLGLDALNSNKTQSMIDGEINQYNEFQYERDYSVGDLVEVRNKDGIIAYKRVTEHIFACDENGERSYPTLSSDLFAGIDDWIAYNSDPKQWIDYDSLSTAWGDV
jgi:Siphovirus ReqiPepy6 Gp37-like protein